MADKTLRSITFPGLGDRYVIPEQVSIDSTLSQQGKAADAKAVGDAFKAQIAPAYSASGTYAVGDLVLYNNALYRCKTAITTAEAWTPAHWEATTLNDVAQKVTDLESASMELDAIEPQVIIYDIGLLVWAAAHTISTSGVYSTSTIRIASSSYVYITAGTRIKVNPGYVVRCASYSAVDFEAGINAFTFRELIKDFTTGDIVIPYSSYYRFAVGLSGSGAASASDGALAFSKSFADGLSVAGNTITNILADVDVTNGITLTSSGDVALNGQMITTDFIPVAENNIYYLDITSESTDVYTTVYSRVIFYDAAKTFSSVARKFNLATSASQIFDIREIISIPSGVHYMRICYPTVGVSAISLGCYGAYDQTARNLLYKIGQDTQTLHKEKYAIKRNNPDMVQQMIAVAESYLDQKSGGSYIMHYGTATPLSTTYQNDKSIDCSTFIGFVLRGIDFQDSPYLIDYPPEDLNPFDPSQFVANPDYLWSINPAKYEYNLYQDIDYPNIAEARRASQIAEMFADQGREIPIDRYYANIEPGDLLFFAKKDSDGEYLQSYRYRHITHIALVINVEDAPQDATWDTTLYPYKHTYIDVSGGAGTDPVRVKVLEEAPVSKTVYGLGTLTCVMRPDIGNITMLNAVTDLSNAIDQKQDATNYVTLSGTIVTQTGADNTMYLCGELAELTFTAPATGQTAIRFSSGTTPTVATFSGVTWLNGFDPSAIEASKTYEINILNGLGCAAWT